RGVLPPRRRCRTAHEIGDRHEGVEHAWILSPAAVRAQRLIQHERVAVREFARVHETKRAQVGRHRRPDGGQLLDGPAPAGLRGLGHISSVLRTRPTATPSSSKSTSPNGTTMVLKSGFSGISSIVLRVRRKRLTVTSSPSRATTIWPFLASRVFCTASRSPS